MTASALERMKRTLAFIKDRGLSGLIAITNGHNWILDSNAVFVLCGFRPLALSALVIAANGETTLIVSPAWDAERGRLQSTIKNVVGTDDIPRAIADALDRHGIQVKNAETVGMSLLGGGMVEQMRAALGELPPESGDFTRDLATIRTAEELTAAREATRIAELGYQRLLASARPGMREFELAADIYCHMKGLGAEDNFLLMSASQHNLAVRAAGQRVLEEGDVILAEITPSYHGQVIQICRTASIGRPNPIMAEKFAILKDSMACGQSAARTGARVSDVTLAMNAPLEAAGYAQYCRPPYMRVRGHGLGVTSTLPGEITSDSALVLDEGMVFVMHPNQYIPETGYLLCGETVVVSRSGALSLSANAAEFDVIEV